MTAPRVLITGGNGHIASKLAQRLLAESDAVLLLWLHANAADEFEAKRGALARQLQAAPGRVVYYHGDLASEQPFATLARTDINYVVHAAAVTRFNVEADLADQVNTQGSEKLFQFCATLPKLQRLLFLSTVYTAGLRDGLIEEIPLDPAAGFANHYERSKWAAEQQLLTRHAHLPWQIARISTILCEDDSGRVGQYNAVHNTLKLLFYGLLPIVPGTAQTPLYLVSSDFVTSALSQLLFQAPAHTIYHVAHALAQAPSLGDFMTLSFQAFAEDSDFAKRKVLPPLYAQQDAFDQLADSVQGFASPVMKQSVGSVAPFSRQLFSFKDVSNRHLLSQLPHYQAPNQHQLIARTCSHLVATRWGRESACAPGV